MTSKRDQAKLERRRELLDRHQFLEPHDLNDVRYADYFPGPEEIAAACRVIQSEWNDLEFERRARGITAGDNADATNIEFDALPITVHKLHLPR